MLDLHSEIEDGVLVLNPSGRIDGATAKDYEETLLDRIADGHSKIVLNCEAVEYVSSAGLRPPAAPKNWSSAPCETPSTTSSSSPASPRSSRFTATARKRWPPSRFAITHLDWRALAGCAPDSRRRSPLRPTRRSARCRRVRSPSRRMPPCRAPGRRRPARP